MCVYLDEDGSRRYLLNKNHYKLTQKLRYECGNTTKSDAAVHTSSLKLDYDISKRIVDDERVRAMGAGFLIFFAPSEYYTSSGDHLQR